MFVECYHSFQFFCLKYGDGEKFEIISYVFKHPRVLLRQKFHNIFSKNSREAILHHFIGVSRFYVGDWNAEVTIHNFTVNLEGGRKSAACGIWKYYFFMLCYWCHREFILWFQNHCFPIFFLPWRITSEADSVVKWKNGLRIIPN